MEERTMKKITLLFAAALSFAACQKESVKDNAPVSASEIVFNLDVNYASDTKAVKTAFTEGDKLFIFFEGVTTGYFTSVSDADGVFASAQLNGTVTIDDLAESGKSLTAVFLPYGNDATPSYGSNWTFDKGTDSYFLKATSAYTLTKASGIATLSATLTMAAPSNYVQFFVPDGEATGSIKLACNAVTPSGLASIASDGTVTEISGGTQGERVTMPAASWLQRPVPSTTSPLRMGQSTTTTVSTPILSLPTTPPSSFPPSTRWVLRNTPRTPSAEKLGQQ